MEEVAGVVVKYFVENYGLYLGSNLPVKCSDLSLDELKDICIVPVLLVGQVVTDVR